MSLCLDLVSFAHGELEPDRAAAFRDHLKTCDACRTGLVEVMQLGAQLSTLKPVDNPTAAVALRSMRQAKEAVCGDDGLPILPWKRTPVRVAGALVLAAAVMTGFLLWPQKTQTPVAPGPVNAPINAFSGVTTRPYAIRLAYSDAAGHRPPRDVALGAGTPTLPADRIPYDALGALERRGDQHGLAIARAWNGEKLGDVLQQLNALPETPSIRSDRAAIEVLTTSNDNVESVLEELEKLRGSEDAAVARAARWNYALVLDHLDLPLSAAKAFQAIADEHEPGWSDEARTRAAPLAQRGQDFEANWKQADKAGQALVDSGEPVSNDLVRERPGVLRAYFYHAVRAAPRRERVLALAPMAAELDRVSGPARHTLSDYVQRVAKLDFRRRAPLASAYADLLKNKPLTEQLVRALTQETASRDVVDIVMGAMFERDVVADHRAWFRAMADKAGDPWLTVVLARAEADAAVATGNWLGAEAILRKAESLCTPDLSYQCLMIERQLGKLYADLHRVHESLAVLQSAVRAARRTGEWSRYRTLLWRLADTERLHSATATVRAYANELLLMGDDCANRGQTYDTLAGAALIDADGPSARRYLMQALPCEPADLRVANHLADIARLDPQPGDLAQLQDMLSKVRASHTLTAAEQVLAGEIEGRLVVERDRAAGTVLLRKAIAEADKLRAEVVADKARANAYAEVIADKARANAFAVLAFAAAREGDHAQVLNLVAEDLGMPAPGACTVAMAAEDERAVVVVRGGDGQDRGDHARDRHPADGVLTVPAQLARNLAGCPRVRVMATAALQGQPRVLPADLAWSYVTGARRRVAPSGSPPKEPHALIVNNVTPPAYLQLPPLAIQPVTSGAATTLSGPEATPARVLAAMADATEIQFHTHALMDVGVSDASHLVLSPEADGRYALTTEAIRNTTLRGHPIIVLAACHAAQGARYLHEPWSLPDAFLAIGARAVFAAATEIPDVESSRFFAGVLERVRAGVDPATALRDQRIAAGWRASSWVGDVIVFE